MPNREGQALWICPDHNHMDQVFTSYNRLFRAFLEANRKVRAPGRIDMVSDRFKKEPLGM